MKCMLMFWHTSSKKLIPVERARGLDNFVDILNLYKLRNSPIRFNVIGSDEFIKYLEGMSLVCGKQVYFNRSKWFYDCDHIIVEK